MAKSSYWQDHLAYLRYGVQHLDVQLQIVGHTTIIILSLHLWALVPALPAMEVSREVNGAMQIKASAKPAAGASGAPTDENTG